MRLLFPRALCAATLLRGPDAARADTPNFFLGPQISTLGFGGFFGDRVNFAFDVGVLFQGDPDVDLDAKGRLSNDPTLRSRLREEEEDIEDDLEFLGFYPVAAISVTIHF